MLQIQYCPTVLFFIFFSISILSHGIRIALKYTKKIIPKKIKKQLVLLNSFMVNRF